MGWFGRKSARERVRLPLARGSGSFASAGDWPQNYEAQVREGYCRNPVAQRAVKLLVEGIGGAELEASDPALVALVRRDRAGRC